MLKYQVHTKVRRNNWSETVLMTKYIVVEEEFSAIERFLGRTDDFEAENIRMAMKRTKRPYEPKYRQDPVVDYPCFSFILFNSDAGWLQTNCLDKMFTPDNINQTI